MGRESQFLTHIASSAFGGAAGQVLFEPQRQYNFSVEISLINSDTIKGFLGVQSVNALTLELALDSAFLPRIKFDTIEARDVNKKISFAGNVSTEHGKLVVKDYILAPVMSTIDSWIREVYDYTTDKPGIPSNYKKKAHIMITGPMAIPERAWELRGVWPVSVDYGTLDMNVTDIVKSTLELNYDYARYIGSTELNAINNIRNTDPTDPLGGLI